MQNVEARVRTHLVLTAGFSRKNAEIAISMYHADELTATEKEVISRIRLDPENDKLPIIYRLGTDPKVWVLDHLNYRITETGGDAYTKWRRHAR